MTRFQDRSPLQDTRMDNVVTHGEYIRRYRAALTGRGENKQVQTSAMAMGLLPYNPYLFGKEAIEPIPYQKILTDQGTMSAVLRGFSDDGEPNQQIQSQAAKFSQMMSTSQLSTQQIMEQPQTSLFQDVPQDPVVNYTNLSIRRARENNLLTLV